MLTPRAWCDRCHICAYLILVIGGPPASFAESPATHPADGLRSSLSEYPDQRSIAVDRHGTIHLVYGDPNTRQVFYRTLDPQGRPQMPAMRVNHDIEATVARERGPRVALGVHDAVYILWQNSDGLVCLRSPRPGAEARFKRVSVLDRQVATDVPTLTNDSAGRVYAVWVDGRHKPDDPLGAELYMAVTGGDGAFGPNLRISDDRYPVCPCCMPEIACRGDTLFVLYRSTRKGIKEMVLRRANRQDLDWRTIVISRDHWRFQGCPMSGGHIAMTPDRIAIVWTASGQVRAAFSTDDGRHFSAPAPVALEQALSRRNRVSDLRDLARRVARGQLGGKQPATSAAAKG